MTRWRVTRRRWGVIVAAGTVAAIGTGVAVVGSGGTSPDTTAPSLFLTAPVAAATVSGSTVTVSATCGDNVGCAGVQFRLDGGNLGAEDTSAPFSIAWDSTTATDGSHTLSAVARDAATNTKTATTITVTVSGAGGSGLLANEWVNTSAGASPSRCSSPCAYDSTHAYGSPDAGYAAAFPGDAVLLRSGSYGAVQINYSSANGKPGTSQVTLAPATGATVTTGNVAVGTNENATSTSHTDYVKFDGRGGLLGSGSQWTVNGIVDVLNAGSHDTINGLHVQTGDNAGVHLIDSEDNDNAVISNNEIGPGCCGADGIELQRRGSGDANPSNITVTGNNVHDIYDTCTEWPTYLTATVACTGTGFGDNSNAGYDHVDGLQALGCQVCTISYNQFLLQGDHKQGIFLGNGNNAQYSDITIKGNLVSATSDQAVSGPSEDSGSDGMTGFEKVLYNTILGSFSINSVSTNGTGFKWRPGATITVAGNIFGTQAGNPSGGGCTGFVFTDNSTLTVTWRNNIFQTQAACDASDHGTTTPTFVQRTFPNVGSCGTGSFSGCTSATGDPNLRLSGAQTAIDGGEGTYCGPTKDVLVDIDGTTRPLGAACDIGADEAG